MTLETRNRRVAAHASSCVKQERNDPYYLEFALELPFLIRRNGLALTLEFLRHKATEKTAVGKLATDWLSSPGIDQALPRPQSVADLDADITRVNKVELGATAYATVSRLCLEAAEWFKRAAQAYDRDADHVTVPDDNSGDAA